MSGVGEGGGEIGVGILGVRGCSMVFYFKEKAPNTIFLNGGGAET